MFVSILNDLNICSSWEQVDSIRYLGTNVNKSWNMSREIKANKSRAVFFRMKKVLCIRSISVHLKLLIRCFSTLFYDWMLTETLLKRLQASYWCCSWVGLVRSGMKRFCRIGTESPMQLYLKKLQIRFL